MNALEAEPLLVPNRPERLNAIAPGVQSSGDEMMRERNNSATAHVLLLVPVEPLRDAASRSGLQLTLHPVSNRREFSEALSAGSIDAIVAAPQGLPNLDLRAIMDAARSVDPPIPVVVVADHPEENDTIRYLRGGASEVLSFRQIARFPDVLSRVLRLRQSAFLEAQARTELDRTADLLRENQKLITLGRLAASITHEINNPLESITNLLYLISEQSDLPSGSRGYLALAQRELERVAQICRQTLNFSRETTAAVRVHIDSLAEEVLSLYGRRIMDKNLRVERQYDCPEEAVVYPGEMRQVLSNLITNAVEASSPNGRLRLRVRCTRAWSDPGVRGIRISVGDNGSGIPQEVQRRLGEPFFTTKGQSGTGLGLWVTRSIIQRYGGEIQLRSSVNPTRHGTVFSIFLPTNLRPHAVDRPHGALGTGSGSAPEGGSGSASGSSVRARTGSTRAGLSPSEPLRRANGGN